MQIISNRTDFILEDASAVAIGKFDGLHRGHKALLSRILEAKKRGLTAVVFTFDPSPAAFFAKRNVKGLTTKSEKRRMFRQMGVDVVVEFPLNEETAATQPEVFIREILCRKLRAAYVAAGEDISFGDRGKGDWKLLQAMARELGYRVDRIEKLQEGNEPISSTRVRSAVEVGRMREATLLLGAPYTVMGTVVHGRRIGHTLGFPTVNLLPPSDKLLPPHGVYLSRVECHRGIFDGLTNVGVRPTVDEGENPQVSVETWLYDFDADMYDSFITVQLEDYLRPEKKFEGVDGLRAQLRKDIEDGRPGGMLRQSLVI